MEVGEDGGQKRRHCVFKPIFSDLKLIDQGFDLWRMEALETLPRRGHFKVFRFFIAFNEFFRNFDFISELCVAKRNPFFFKSFDNFL